MKSRKSETPEDKGGAVSEGTAKRIVAAATRLFSEKGYAGTSTKEICDTAQVNIAAVHYHFESKESLYRHIIQAYGAPSLESARRTLQPAHSSEEFRVRLEIFVREVLESVISQPELIRIINRELDCPNSPASDEIFRNTFLKLVDSLVEFLTAAKRQKLIRKELDPLILAGLIYGAISQQTRIGSVSEKYFGVSVIKNSEYRENWIRHHLAVILEGILEK